MSEQNEQESVGQFFAAAGIAFVTGCCVAGIIIVIAALILL